jgi:hypothetical protein
LSRTEAERVEQAGWSGREKDGIEHGHHDDAAESRGDTEDDPFGLLALEMREKVEVAIVAGVSGPVEGAIS